uniref:Uncharacterized protein n=1 Tax=Trichogramma kaykai TaxID=54128 RepID=A0ABD2WB12_9HYME
MNLALLSKILSCAPIPYRRAHCAERLAAAARLTTLSPVSELEQQQQQQQQQRRYVFFFFSSERKRKENLLCVIKFSNIISLTAHSYCTESESLRSVAAAARPHREHASLRARPPSLFIASIVHSRIASCGLYNNNGILFSFINFVYNLPKRIFHLFSFFFSRSTSIVYIKMTPLDKFVNERAQNWGKK